MKALKREGGKSLCRMASPEGVSVWNGLALGESLCGIVWPWGSLCVEWSGLGEVSVRNGPAPGSLEMPTPFSSLTISKQSICI